MKRKREESKENTDNSYQDPDETHLKILKAFEATNKHMSLPPYNRGIVFLILDYFLREFNKARRAHHGLRNENHYKDLSELLKDYKVIFEISLANIQKDIIGLSLTPEILSSFLKSALTFPIGKFILDRELKDHFKEDRGLKRLQLEIARAMNFHTGNCATYSALLFYHLQKLKLKNTYIISLRDPKSNCNAAHFTIVIGACQNGQIFSSLKDQDCIIVDSWSGKVYLSCKMAFDKEIWNDYHESRINIYASTNDEINFNDCLLDKETSEKAEKYIDDIVDKFLKTLNGSMPRERVIDRSILEEAKKHAGSFDLDDVLDHARDQSIEESRRNLASSIIAIAWKRRRSHKLKVNEISPSSEIFRPKM